MKLIPRAGRTSIVRSARVVWHFLIFNTSAVCTVNIVSIDRDSIRENLKLLSVATTSPHLKSQKTSPGRTVAGKKKLAIIEMSLTH
jgi:hypothetical protein